LKIGKSTQFTNTNGTESKVKEIDKQNKPINFEDGEVKRK